MSDFQTEVDLLVKTDAELTQLKGTREELEGLLKTAKDGGRDTGELETRLKEVNQQLASRSFAVWEQGLQQVIDKERAAGNSTAELEKQLQAVQQTQPLSGFGKVNEALRDELSKVPGVAAITNVLNGSTLAVGAAFGIAAEGIEKGVEALKDFGAQEQEVAGLNASLAGKGVFTQEMSAQLQELAHSMQEVTGIAEGQWTGAIQRLLTFPNADPQKIGQYVEAVKHLVAITGMDVEQASLLFGRAMEGNTQMLARYGIQVEKTGDQEKDLGNLMNQLAARDGGILEARMDTLSGATTGLKNATEDLMKGVGGLLDRLLPVKEALSGVAWELDALTKFYFPATIKVTEDLNNVIGSTVVKSDEATEASKKLADEGLAKITKASNDAEAALNKTIKRMDDITRRKNEMVDANAEFEIAKVNAGEGQYKGLTESQRTLKIEQIKAQAEAEKQGNSDANVQAVTAARLKANKQASDAADAAEKVAQDAEKKRDALNAANAAKDQEALNARSRGVIAKNARDADQEALNGITAQINSQSISGVYAGNPADLQMQKQLQDAVAQHQKEMEESQRQVAEAEKDAVERKAAAAKANDEANAARTNANQLHDAALKTIGDNNDDINDRIDQNDSAKAIGKVKQQTQALQAQTQAKPQQQKEAVAGAQTAAVAAETQAGDIVAGEFHPARGAGKNPNETDKQYQARLKEYDGLVRQLQTALAAAEKDKGGTPQEQQLILSIMTRMLGIIDKSKLPELTQWISSLKQMDKRLSTLESQVKNNRTN